MRIAHDPVTAEGRFEMLAIADADATVYVSAASAWEIATKVRLGRLSAHGDVVPRFGELAAAADLRHLAVTHRHGLRAGSYPTEHRDPSLLPGPATNDRTGAS